MIKSILITLGFLVTFTGCYIESDQLLSTPLILTFPVGKPWKVQNITISEDISIVSDTDTIAINRGDVTYLFNQYDNMFFYSPIGTDPNAGRIETYGPWGSWRSEILSNRLEYLTISFSPMPLNKYLLLNRRWRVTDKWSNRIEMTNDNGYYLTIVTSN